MNTLTLRKIPSPVEKGIRRVARESHQSLNKTAIDLLSKGVGIGPEKVKSRKRRDVKSVIKPWSEDEYKQFQHTTETFSIIDKDLWRK
jgi:hypothetical protein